MARGTKAVKPSFFKYRLLPLLGAVVCAAGGWFLLQLGMNSLQEVRQLERVPLSPVAAVVGGEVQVYGTVSPGETIASKYTETASVYYRYRHEVEQTDSDGNSSWHTRAEGASARNFKLQDASGQLLVLANTHQEMIDWRLSQSWQQVSGKHRYTEWRLEPGHSVFAFGMASLGQLEPVLGFNRPGDYTAIISRDGAAAVRESSSGLAVYFLTGGIALISFVGFCLAVLLRIHRLWQYLSMLTLGLVLLVTDIGLTMLKTDLSTAVSSLQYRETEAVKMLSANRLSEHNQSVVRVNLATGRARLESHLDRFPDTVLARLWGLELGEPGYVLLPREQTMLQASDAALVRTQLQGALPVALVFVGLIFSAIFTWWGFRMICYQRLIENVPTQRSVGVAPGISELAGSVSLIDETRYLQPRLTGEQSVWYDWRLYELKGGGKNKSWNEIEQDSNHITFLCRDAEGVLEIQPADAEIITSHVVEKKEGRYKQVEKSLRVGDCLYAIGAVKQIDTAATGVAMVGRQKKLGWPFILSNLSEREVMLGKSRLGLFLLNLAFSSVVLTSLLLFANVGSFSPYDFLLASLVAPLYMFCMVVALHYNDLVFLRQRSDRDRANIDVALKKRKNLIPHWQSVVKGYLAHEQRLQQHLVKLREAHKTVLADPTFLPRYENFEKAVLARIQVKVEQYPDLQGEKMVGDMMKKISALETEIAYLRAGYNNSVTQYNQRLNTFPDVFLARYFRFAPYILL